MSILWTQTSTSYLEKKIEISYITSNQYESKHMHIFSTWKYIIFNPTQCIITNPFTQFYFKMLRCLLSTKSVNVFLFGNVLLQKREGQKKVITWQTIYTVLGTVIFDIWSKWSTVYTFLHWRIPISCPVVFTIANIDSHEKNQNILSIIIKTKN